MQTDLYAIYPEFLDFFRYSALSLDAWPHLRHNMRSFSIDTILDPPAKQVAAKTIDQTVGDYHWIFLEGSPLIWPKFLFTPELACFVSRKRRHSKQLSKTHLDGGYVMETTCFNERDKW